jgi:hypothetical protein
VWARCSGSAPFNEHVAARAVRSPERRSVLPIQWGTGCVDRLVNPQRGLTPTNPAFALRVRTRPTHRLTVGPIGSVDPGAASSQGPGVYPNIIDVAATCSTSHVLWQGSFMSDRYDERGPAQSPPPIPPKPTGQLPAERRDIAAVLDELQAIRLVLEDIRTLTRGMQDRA